MHLVYRGAGKLEYVRHYPRSHLMMRFLAFDRRAFYATFGGITSLTRAGSFCPTRMIENADCCVSVAYFLQIRFDRDRNRLHILFENWLVL
ncbi:MAG: hypothetical protein C0507_13010 [Cyanobacteria bacterium PR.3.49]|nr:hypothetical protein [Cyanobacteria bacterium PR.3.49]